jgi:predicted DCC family thiol-disulfide oxidoreductase YuxK
MAGTSPQDSAEGRLPDRLLLFDGECNLCNGTVNFIIRHDRRKRFLFAPLQGPFAETHFPGFVPRAGSPQTLVYHRLGKTFTRSTGALHIARDLDGAWPLCFALIVVPRFLRDPVYDLVARYRYRWFGRLESCMVPTPELRDRFL